MTLPSGVFLALLTVIAAPAAFLAATLTLILMILIMISIISKPEISRSSR